MFFRIDSDTLTCVETSGIEEDRLRQLWKAYKGLSYDLTLRFDKFLLGYGIAARLVRFRPGGYESAAMRASMN